MELKGKGNLMGNNHKPKEVLIFGAGSFGEEVLDFLDDINCIHPTYRCIGFLDDEEKKWGGKLHGVPILGAFSESNKFPLLSYIIPPLLQTPNISSLELVVLPGQSKSRLLISPSGSIVVNASILTYSPS